MSPPRYEILLLIAMLIVLILGIISHVGYWIRINSHISDTAGIDVGKQDLRKALHMHHGSNFNTIYITSWSLLLVAFIYLYFMTPQIFSGLNYFRVPNLASGSFGLAALGAAVILIPGSLAALFIPRACSYYTVTRRMKRMSLLAPVLLIISIFCSINLGSIYPTIDSFYWNLGFVTLILALVILLAPFIMGFAEEMRM